MKKLKKFKINLRKREILNNFKLISEIKDITPQIEELALSLSTEAQGYMSPEAVFDTYQLKAFEEKLSIPIETNVNAVAISLVMLTIGENIEKKIQELQNAGERLKAGMLSALAMEACNSGANFIYTLLKDEAVSEDCELLPYEKITDAETEKKIIDFMSPGRINISLDENNSIHPIYTAFGIVKWKPRKRKSK